MATAQQIITDALIEIGAFAPDETIPAQDLALGLTRLTNEIDAWNAERLTIYVTQRTTYTLTSGTNTVTIGSTGTINVVRPVWINDINYIVPGTNPAVEVPMGKMDDDSYANLSIKDLRSSLPTQWYYNETFPLGTLFFWPTVTQNVTIALYYPQSAATPTSLSSVLVGPPGYQDAFMYDLAMRLWTPYHGQAPLSGVLPANYQKAFARMQRPQIAPGLLGIDAALVPSSGGAYNVLNDQFVSPSNR